MRPEQIRRLFSLGFFKSILIGIVLFGFSIHTDTFEQKLNSSSEILKVTALAGSVISTNRGPDHQASNDNPHLFISDNGCFQFECDASCRASIAQAVNAKSSNNYQLFTPRAPPIS